MIERIKTNEERLDNILVCVNKLKIDLESLICLKKDLYELNKYYGSKEWFSDKEELEKGNINIKAGVLSEDAVWDLFVDIKELCDKMIDISNEILDKETK